MIERAWLALMCGVLSLLALASGAAVVGTAAREAESEIFRAGKIEIIDPWASSSIGQAHAAAVYFEFRNRSGLPDRLIAARTSLAGGGVELRSGESRAVDGIPVPPDEKGYELNRGSYHLTLQRLESPLTMGKRFPLELTFEHAGTITVIVTSRFHSPQLARRIREAAHRGDIETLKKLKE